MQFTDYFSFQIFFIFLRESLEITVIISILLTIVKQGLAVTDESSTPQNERYSANVEDDNGGDATRLPPLSVVEEEELFEHGGELLLSGQTLEDSDNIKLYTRLKTQIISGGAAGLLLCMMVGGVIVGIFYHIGTDLWSLSEHYYEGVLSIVASVIISVMGLFFLRMGKLREKFRVKLASIIYSSKNNMLQNKAETSVKFTEKYAFFFLPFITALREGLEAVVFVGGVGIDQPLTSIPLSMLAGTAISAVFGFYFFQYSKSMSLKICLIVATCFLYLIASGLFSKGVWQLELQDYVNKCNGQDMSEVGSGPGSYDISRSLWHVNCCNGETDGGWMILTAIFGWTNSATYGSVISYNCYWLLLIGVLRLLIIEEKHAYLPFLPVSWQKKRILKKYKIAKASLDLRETMGESSSAQQPSTIGTPRISKDSSTPLLSA